MIDIGHNPSLKSTLSISNIDIFILDTGFEESFRQLCDSGSKSLIKVINKPLLAYQLEFLEQCNIRDVFIITNKANSKSIDDYLSTQFFGEKIKPVLITTNKEGMDIFSIIKNKLTKSNFILMTGDSILSFDLNSLIDAHIEEKCLVSMILNDISNNNNQKLNFLKEEGFEAFGVCGGKRTNEQLNKVVYYNKKESADSKDQFSIKKNILKHAQNFSLLYNYEDIHFYIFNKNIFSIIDNFAEDIKKMPSIKNDFIPFLIKKSFSKKINNILRDSSLDKPNLVRRVNIKSKILSKNPSISPISEYVYRVINYPRLLQTVDEIQKPYENIEPIYFQTRNNTKNYFMNFAQQIQTNLDNNKQFNDGVPEIESVSMDSYVTDPIISLGKGTRVNRSVVGANLTLKEGCKITSCLLYDNVVVGKDCKISNCIIGDNAIIGDNCKIVDCVVVGNYFVKEGTNVTGKILSDESNDSMII